MADSASPLRKVLVANRGEVAVRIIRACRDFGIGSVVTYSEPDRDSLPVLIADEAVCIGPAPAADSYLNVSRVLSAAEISGCDAVHPGYGFLSESAEFVEATESCGLTYIGPSAETMRLLGDKISARRTALEAGVPVLPGSVGELRDYKEAAKLGRELGYPVLIKAAAGGGGKGMRVVRREKDLESGFRMCQAEAKAAFGDGRVYLEKYLSAAHHIEIQVLADKHGNCIHLGERDCSAQRRHQKLLEESPSPLVDAALRARLGGWAVAIARAAGYTSAGTVEFILDDDLNPCFLEMNTRLQVEHPVTEEVTDVDIVRRQFLIAAGEKLDLPPDAGEPRGHAIECRIYAEDPDADFEPSPGLVTDLRMPGGPGIRIESCLLAGWRIPPWYDPLVAKVIARGRDRAQAIARMDRALAETVIGGVATTVEFHRRLLKSGRFLRGRHTTSMLDEV
ncbi:MAG TPA: acetyl-CoA carboxylase biotin carboxylase subunit [candidate division WOR-3 bacterium]|uniref:biotin carboxylase n=1 Tax=candidate division WOR-3 bacterium TaxID=2052148 RepID=A0A7V0T6W8_UNCW3|nr:acetyl-CoA carboxylase biotin carboxylase subunit [candidate division WOR-3 bacterium]